MFEKIKNLFLKIKQSKLIVIGILILILIAIPITVFVLQRSQEIRQQAAGGIPNFRAYCLQTTGPRSTENSCTKTRLYWDPIPNAKWYFIKLYNRDNGSWQGKWSRTPRIDFDNIIPNQMYEAGIRSFTQDFTQCDLSQNYNNSSGVVQKSPSCSIPANDQAASAWYTQNAPNAPEEWTDQYRMRLPNDGEIGMQGPNSLTASCANVTCTNISLAWQSANGQIRPLKKFLVRVPPYPPAKFQWLSQPSTTITDVSQNTIYDAWTVQEYQGESDMTDLELYTGGILSFQQTFPAINTTQPTATPVPLPTNTPIPTIGPSATPTRVPTGNPTPTRTPTPSPTARPTVTLVPTRTPTPSSGVKADISISLPGIAVCFAIPTRCVNNSSPKNPTRTLTVEAYNNNNEKISEKTTTITYSPVSRTFKGTVNFGNIPSGSYSLRFKLQNYLIKTVPGIQTLGIETRIVPVTELVGSDINNDNVLNALDYGMFLSCYENRANTNTCSNKLGADANDDGVVDNRDYLIMFNNFATQN